jgi:hypothetical protein
MAELKCLELFCTGVVLLMKKKLEEGLGLLSEARTILELYYVNKHCDNKSNNTKISTKEYHKTTSYLSPKFFPLINSILHAYLAYAYYCLNQI